MHPRIAIDSKLLILSFDMKFFVCLHVSIWRFSNCVCPSVCLSVHREKNHPSFVNISPPLVIMPSPSVTGEAYCFPRRQIANKFSALVCVSYINNIIRKVFENTFQNRFRLSVCTAIFKGIARLRFYPKYLMLCIRWSVVTSSTNK